MAEPETLAHSSATGTPSTAASPSLSPSQSLSSLLQSQSQNSSSKKISLPNSARVRDPTNSRTNTGPSIGSRPRASSRQERLDDILEGARKRKVQLDREAQEASLGERREQEQVEQEEEPDNTIGGRTRSGSASPALQYSSIQRMDSTRRDTENGDTANTPMAAAESSADEETHVFRRRNQGRDVMDYQGTAVFPQQSPGQSPGRSQSLRAGGGKRAGRGGGVRSKPSTSSIRRSGKTHDPSAGQHSEDNGMGGDEHEDEQEGWWARLLSDYGSLELENKGSVARDHLALERTFLAWLRTSLAFASIGIAITQLFRLNTAAASGTTGDPYKHLRQMGKPLGATFLGISIVMLGVGFHRYFESQHWIIRGKFPASRGSIALVAAITFALSITSLVIVIVVEPGQFEKK